MTEDLLEEVRILRHVVGEVVNHCAGGGKVDRHGALFKDLRRVHRATLGREVERRAAFPELDVAPWFLEADPRYWQNLACCVAFWAGELAARMAGPWAAVLDSMLEAGGRETSLARSLAQLLGIELRQSHDGGETWYPVPQMRCRLSEATDDELRRELEKRGSRFVETRGLQPHYSRPVAGEQVMIFGRVAAQFSHDDLPTLGLEAILQRAREQTGGVIGVNREDFEMLRRRAAELRYSSTLTLQGIPVRVRDAMLNTEAAIADAPLRGRTMSNDFVDAMALTFQENQRRLDALDENGPQPPVVHVVHDWIGQQGQRRTLCGQGDAETAWSQTDQGMRVNCDACIKARAAMERNLEPERATEGVSSLRPVPGGVFGYRPGRGGGAGRSRRKK